MSGAALVRPHYEAAGQPEGEGHLTPSLRSQMGGVALPFPAVKSSVELLVLVNAMIPRPGETGAEWWSNTGQQEAMHAQLGALGLPPESAEDDPTIYFHDVSPEVSAHAFQRGEPTQSWTPMTQPWPLSGWPSARGTGKPPSVGCEEARPAGFSHVFLLPPPSFLVGS
jgi:hypothetical protein